MQKIIQINPCLLKLSGKQDTTLKIGDFSTKTKIFPQNPCFQYYHRFIISLQANNLTSLSPYATDLTSDR